MNFGNLYEVIERRIGPKGTKVIGIVGLPGSGKSTLSANFAAYLSSHDVAAVPWEGDMYSTSDRANRTAMIKMHYRDKLNAGLPVDPDWSRQAYHYNLELMCRHFDKFRMREGFLSERLCNPKRKSLDLRVRVDFPDLRKTRVLFEQEKIDYEGGSTLFLADFALLTRSDMREKLDLLVYVGAPYNVRADRIRNRLSRLPAPLPLDEDILKSIEASQVRDFEVYPERAHIVIDNTNFNSPRIVRG